MAYGWDETKRVKQVLSSIGLKRNETTVRTKVSRHGEFAGIEISLLIPSREMVPRIMPHVETLLDNCINVTRAILAGFPDFISLTYNNGKRGEYVVLDLDKIRSEREELLKSWDERRKEGM